MLIYETDLTNIDHAKAARATLEKEKTQPKLS